MQGVADVQMVAAFLKLFDPPVKISFAVFQFVR
jgi:hypothetical protein